MADYKLLLNGIVLRVADGAFIPNDSANADRQAFNDWVAAGGVPDPIVDPSDSPFSIARRQFFQQLAIQSIISEDDALASTTTIPPAILTVINLLPEDQRFATKMMILQAQNFERNHPTTIGIGAAYGWNSGQIDDFFRAAAQL